MKIYVHDGPVMTEVEHPRHWPDSELYYSCKEADKVIGDLRHRLAILERAQNPLAASMAQHHPPPAPMPYTPIIPPGTIQ